MTAPFPESTPRERLARVVALMSRTRMFARSAAMIAAVGIALALAVALRSKRIYRSETTVFYRDAVQRASGEGESPAARAARLGPKLKDLLYARPSLEAIIVEHDLFPDKRRKSMLDALEEMTTATTFRARASDSYVISFSYEDAAVAQRVAARLAERMIEDYDRQNLDGATITRDFLRRKLEEATAGVDDASRALATFLAEHPQFQWGGADSPYAPAPPGTPLARAAPRGAQPADPELRALERELLRVEAELSPPAPGGEARALTTVPEAQRRRDAAAAALASAESALAEKLTSVTAAHPDAVSAAARVTASRQALANADAALARARVGSVIEAPGTRAPPTPERQRALTRERASLRRQIEARRGVVSPPRASGAVDVVELETEWHRLRLALDHARAELNTIQQNARTAEIAADAIAKRGRDEMQILEPAYFPTRPDRGRGRVFFAGATIALFLAFGYAAARVLLDDTLLDEGDLAAIGAPSVIVAMPRLARVEPPIASRTIVRTTRAPDGEAEATSALLALPSDTALACPRVECAAGDPEIELLGIDVDPSGSTRILEGASREAKAALRVLRHRLEQRRGEGSIVVSVLSAGRGEGRTTLALRLALTLAEAERARVSLVDGHFEAPRVAAELALRLPPEASFSAQIHARMAGHGAPWRVVRIRPSLTLLAEPELRAPHPDAIHATHFEAAIAALRRTHDIVIVDGPPILGSGDANVIEAVSDAAIIVVRASFTQGRMLTRAIAQLGSSRVVGVVLNDVVIA